MNGWLTLNIPGIPKEDSQKMSNNILLVAFGGAAGSVLRGLASTPLPEYALHSLGYLLVNILGSLLIGLLWGLFTRHIDEQKRLLLVTVFAAASPLFQRLVMKACKCCRTTAG